MRQVQVDALRAHAEARQKLPSFLEALEDLGKRLGVTSQSRPGGLKKLERYMEKYLRFDLVPLDILAAKLVFTDLQSLYQAAERVSESFTVVGLRDRFAQPRASGYRDIQFIVDLVGHYAELKLCHADFDELDAHEHTLYEMRRTLETKSVLSHIDTLVLDSLENLSAQWYSEIWKSVLLKEGGEQ